MEQKTNITAEEGKQQLLITRVFDLPLDLLFKAYTDPAILGEWMGTKVLKHENKQHGSWQFETTDANGKVLFRANGVIHSFVPDRQIIRTFEMENTPFGVQLEFLEFKQLTDDTSQFNMHIVYRSVADRDQMLQIGMSQGMNMAHNRLQDVARKLK